MRSIEYGFVLFLVFGMCFGELRLLQIVYRNKPSVAEILYPSDSYKFWEGAAKIAKFGIQQLQQMGQRLRNRYMEFLTSSPSEETVYQAKNEDCTSLARCFVSGLYKPGEGYPEPREFPWKPIKKPEFSEHELMVCPETSFVSSNIYDSEEGREIISQNKELYKYWSIHSGLDIKNPTDASSLYRTLYLEKTLNLSTPDWAERFWKELKRQSKIHFSWLAKSKYMQKLTAGPLLGMMIHRMEDYIHHNHKEKRIFLYSGKNSNVAGLLSTFGAFDGLEPFFGSTVVVELHEFGWEYYVRVLYFRSSKPDVQVKAPEVITLQGCSEYCSFERFQELTRPLIPEDWEEECGFSRASPVHPAILHLMLLLVFLLVN